MSEDIIGFVMGALDTQEHQRIEDLIRSDTELQSQVDLIRRSLRPLNRTVTANPLRFAQSNTRICV